MMMIFYCLLCSPQKRSHMHNIFSYHFKSNHRLLLLSDITLKSSFHVYPIMPHVIIAFVLTPHHCIVGGDKKWKNKILNINIHTTLIVWKGSQEQLVR